MSLPVKVPTGIIGTHHKHEQKKKKDFINNNRETIVLFIKIILIMTM